MMIIRFLFLLLITNIFCIDTIGRNEKKTIFPSNSTGYIYIDLSQFPLYEEIYLTLKSTVGDLDRDIYTQYTQSEEITDDFRSIYPFGSVITPNTKTFYYNLYSTNDKYLVIKYCGFYPHIAGGALEIETSDKYPLSDFVKTVIIVVVSIVGVGLIVGVGVILFLCLRKKTIVGSAGGMSTVDPLITGNPQGPYVNNYQPNVQPNFAVTENMYPPSS